MLELMGPHTTAQFRGFAPPLSPRLIASHHTRGDALAVSKGLDRDRAVDETGHQIAVFGRLGARPLNLQEMQRMYLRNGVPWMVTDQPATDPQPFTHQAEVEEPAKKAKPPKGPRRGPKRPARKRPGAR